MQVLIREATVSTDIEALAGLITLFAVPRTVHRRSQLARDCRARAHGFPRRRAIQLGAPVSWCGRADTVGRDSNEEPYLFQVYIILDRISTVSLLALCVRDDQPPTIDHPATSLGPRYAIATAPIEIFLEKAFSDFFGDLTRSCPQRLGGTKKGRFLSTAPCLLSCRWCARP